MKRSGLLCTRLIIATLLIAIVPVFSLSRNLIQSNPPVQPLKLCFIHHSCGNNWLKSSDGQLGLTLNGNKYYVTETNYGWSAESGDKLGDMTNTDHWTLWFNDTKMPYVYKNNSHYAFSNTIADPGGENQIIMFKSCYPLSKVGNSIEDEKNEYNKLLAYFAEHVDKLFILITPPGEMTVPSWKMTRDLCQWLVNNDGWLKNYPYKNVGVFDLYCILSEKGSHHRVKNGKVDYIYASDYDGVSPYHSNDNHPNQEGNIKATEEFITIINMYYTNWKNSTGGK